MQSDRELLELAAKAAGVCLHPEDQLKRSYGNWGCDTTCMVCKKDPSGAQWRPLTNDGDALRLMVKLHLCVEVVPGCTTIGNVTWIENPDEGEVDGVIHGTDPMAATRRAITRAAASLAQAAQEGK